MLASADLEMVAVFNNELLSWYLITLKLKETLGSGIPSSPNSGIRSLEFPQRQNLQHERSESLQIIINDDGEHFQEEANSPDSEWMISMRGKLHQARQDDAARSWAKISIYRIPHYLRDGGGDDKAFVPQIVSLGPYHHGKRRLRQMDRHKWRSFHHVLKRTNHDIKLYLDSMKEIEERARCCYEGPISLSSNEFVEMLVLDGCFVLELFRGATEGFEKLGYSRNDPVFAMRGSMHSIQRDMIMLENQLPLFVLDRLLGLQLGNPDQKGSVATLALRFFDPLMPTDEPLTKSDRNKLESSLRSTLTFDPLCERGDLHCLDVFRRSLLRTGPQPAPKRRSHAHRVADKRRQQLTHCVTELKEAGIKFKKRKTDRFWDIKFKKSILRRSLLRTGPQPAPKRRSQAHRVADKRRQQLIHCVTELKEAGIKFKKRKTDRFWDIKFKNGILRMPRLLIHDGTKSLFLNLIAFEQCHLDCSNDITSYVIFLDNLINSPADVAYLHYCGIIEHWLGSDDEVADLFNRLCQEVIFDFNNSYLSPLSEAVNRYYNHRWNAWLASLRHNYFSNPWAIISLVAAIVLLLLTFAQTYYTIYAYYRPVG